MLKTEQSFHKNKLANVGDDTLFWILYVTKELNKRPESLSECTFQQVYMGRCILAFPIFCLWVVGEINADQSQLWTKPLHQDVSKCALQF